jgi:diguanylate cyclase (GGDEF)-like protein
LSKKNSQYGVFKDIKILVVEDNESELEELCELFSIYFKVCYGAVDGSDGLKKFSKYHPDIVLTDFDLLGIDGLDMSEKIREADDEAVIVLHTVFTDVNTFLRAIKCKISGYIVKPTNVRNLLDVLEREANHILENKELKKKNLLMQSVLDEFPEPMMVTDLDHNVLFANNQIRKNRFWQKDKPMKCHKALHGFDTYCDGLNHKCDSLEVANLGMSVVHSHEVADKNGNKTYLNIKTIPLKDEKGDVYALLKSIQDKTSDKKRELALQYIANHDALTGVPNRILLNDRLNQAMLRSDRDKASFAVMFIDFDEFKNINDIYGHKVGDMVLIQATFRIQETIRKIDTIARIGGDEFVVVLENITDKKQVENIAKELLKKLSVTFDINDRIKIDITCSIGIDMYNPNKVKKSKEELLQDADCAMYKVKKSGKNGFEFDLEASIDG